MKRTVNSIGVEGAKMISESLMKNTTLTELNLNDDPGKKGRHDENEQ